MIGVANVVQTVPSLALFGLLLPVPWLGENAARLAIVALTGYALLPILRNTYAGIGSVDPALVDVANALGMTGWQRLMKVELPMAASVILAGLRTATVTCVGVATIAAAIGAGGLGELIFRGVASVDNGLVLAGAIPAALLALWRMRGWGGWRSGWRCGGERLRVAVSKSGVSRRMAKGGLQAVGRQSACGGFLVGSDGVCAAAVVADCDWGEELYRAGGAGGVGGAGD